MLMIKLAWKNLDRNRNRTIITVSAIFFAVVLSVMTSSLRAGIFDKLVDNLTRTYVGKYQIHAAGYWEQPTLDNSFSETDRLKSLLVDQPLTKTVLPRIESFVLVASDNASKGGQLVGIDPEKEASFSDISTKVVKGNYFRKMDQGIMVADGLLRRLGVRLGDTLVLLGQGYQGSLAAGKYPIQGVLHFGSPELNNHLIYLPLLLAQEFLQAHNRLTAYVIHPPPKRAYINEISTLQGTLGNGFEIMSWSDMMPDIRQHIETDTRNMRIVQWILYLLVSFGIFSTLLMMMSERIHEFGMLLALGMRKVQLARMLIWESMLVYLIGIATGLLASIPIVMQLNRHPIRIGGSIAEAYERFGFEAVFPTSIAAQHFWEQGVNVFVIGTALSFYLVLRIYRLDPVTAMR